MLNVCELCISLLCLSVHSNVFVLSTVLSTVRMQQRFCFATNTGWSVKIILIYSIDFFKSISKK